MLSNFLLTLDIYNIIPWEYSRLQLSDQIKLLDVRPWQIKIWKVQAEEVLTIVSIWINRYVFWKGLIIKTWLWHQHFPVYMLLVQHSDWIPRNCNISYPDMAKGSNDSMGGVNLNDMLILLYRINIQTRKRWYLKIITYLVKISDINGWLLHIRYIWSN